ncbi:hypothetical protein CBR_g5655 [Chara braunii]|uniref:R3H domain-containing protein n=1 Tax=Chara braunii TaxID=69332 RepID=A0A388JRQ7_CHABU|nr:hypothetical protein CBR_g5655 [Chara braunii]|eukprot:GBG60481.1 hypothetical protein CBR_g5655 [Chara braunii]
MKLQFQRHRTQVSAKQVGHGLKHFFSRTRQLRIVEDHRNLAFSVHGGGCPRRKRCSDEMQQFVGSILFQGLCQGQDLALPMHTASSPPSCAPGLMAKRNAVQTILAEEADEVGEDSLAEGVPDDSEESIRERLIQLRNGSWPHGASLVFPSSLSSAKRAYAHDLAERLGLQHTSAGSAPNRRLTVRRQTISERLLRLQEMVDEEEAASRALLSTTASPAQSGQMLESQGLLLRGAAVLEKEAAAFGRERWVVGKEGPGRDHTQMESFLQRARPGSSIRLAVKNSVGEYVVAEGQPAGRVAWSRTNRICVIFDSPPAEGDDEDGADTRGNKPSVGSTRNSISIPGDSVNLLLVPDSLTFDRFRSTLAECQRSETEAQVQKMLSALLGTSLDLGTDANIATTIGSKSPGLLAPLSSFFDESLNEEQRRAVTMCVDGPHYDSPCPSPVVLVHGPFGTGKTRTLVEVIRQRVANQERVLVCAASNAAVDNIALALLEADRDIGLARAGLTERVNPLLAAHTLDSLRESQPESELARELRKQAHAAAASAKKWIRAADGGQRRRAARMEANALFKDARRLERAASITVLRRTSVLCGTLTGFVTSLHDVGRLDDGDLSRFDCVVIDEASQATTPAVLMTLPYICRRDQRQTGGTGGGGGGSVENLSLSSTTSGSRRPPGEWPRPVMILAGDHRQLPPTVISADVPGHGGGLAATLFEELMERDGGGLGTWSLVYGASEVREAKAVNVMEMAKQAALYGRVHGLHEEKGGEARRKQRSGRISSALTVQYRMPASLMAFPSAAFYGGSLVAGASTQSLSCVDCETLRNRSGDGLLRNGCWLEVIDTAGAGYEEETSGAIKNSSRDGGARQSRDGESLSTCNRKQGELTARVVQEVIEFGLLGTSRRVNFADVAVVTPYSAQVMILREMLSRAVADGLEIDSIDGFQGREKAVVILDCVRSNNDSNVGFLSDHRRLNVAISRARNKLVVIGDSATLAVDPVWKLFYDWASLFSNHACRGIESVVSEAGSHETQHFAYRSVFELPPPDGW